MMPPQNGKTPKAGKDAGSATAGRCPICGKPRVPEYRPFCSKRCADIDLGRWLKGAYVVPGNPDAEEDGGKPPTSGED
jgi:uncharacterized protein